MLRFVLPFVVLLTGCSGCGRGTGNGAASDGPPGPEDAAALVSGLRQDHLDGTISFRFDNRRPVIATPRIDQIVAIGEPALPHLLQMMQREDISLDVLARCYSAVDQILHELGRSEPIAWHGGPVELHTRIGPLGEIMQARIVGIPAIEGYSLYFRLRQFLSILDAAEDVGLKIQTSPAADTSSGESGAPAETATPAQEAR